MHLSVIILIAMALALPSASLVNFFPSDRTKVVWAHGTNSIASVKAAIDNPAVKMLEADLQMGFIYGSNETKKIPVMAHGPEIHSDLSFDAFLRTLMDFNFQFKDTRFMKGIKLDFKGVDVMEPVLKVLVANEAFQFPFPVWVNADILRGPINAESQPIDPIIFLDLTRNYLPEATISAGWKTRFGTEGYLRGSYTIEHCDEMIAVLKSRNISSSTPVTYPIRAGLGTQSIDVLRYLVDKSEKYWKDSSITLWHGGEDPKLDVTKLKQLVDIVGRHRCFVDIGMNI